MAMITSAKRSRWESDIPIAHLQAAGLNAPSVVRLKLFTIDTAFILQIRGSLADEDRAALAKRLKQLFSYWKE